MITNPKRKPSPAIIWGMVGVAAVAAGLLIGFSVMSGRAKPADVNTAKPAAGTDAALKADRNRMGSTGAKVQLVEYGDYL
ncbi:MAG TPA: hypothetical protein VGK74_27110 [Symbiobacteriaceae bacterium]|jgi:hypothetical protein